MPERRQIENREAQVPEHELAIRKHFYAAIDGAAVRHRSQHAVDGIHIRMTYRGEYACNSAHSVVIAREISFGVPILRRRHRPLRSHALAFAGEKYMLKLRRVDPDEKIALALAATSWVLRDRMLPFLLLRIVILSDFP